MHYARHSTTSILQKMLTLDSSGGQFCNGGMSVLGAA